VGCSEPTWEIIEWKLQVLCFHGNHSDRQTMWLSVRPAEHWAVRPSVHRPSDQQTTGPSDHKLFGPSDHLTIYSSDLQTIGPTHSQTTIPPNGQPIPCRMSQIPHTSPVLTVYRLRANPKYLSKSVDPVSMFIFCGTKSCWVTRICCEIQYVSLFLLSGFPKPSLPFVMFTLHDFMSDFIVHSFYMHSLLWHVYI
jgi:hypothetical protein